MQQRPIKFRAWDYLTSQMFEVVGFSRLSKEDTENEPEWKHCKEIQEIAVRQFRPDETFEKPNWRSAKTLILEQFTGLLDKNGKEIWEGDLVDVGGQVFQIGWYVRSAAFWLITVAPRANEAYLASGGVPARDYNWLDCGKAVYWHESKVSAPVEVIGDIHNNPDLIESGETKSAT